MSDIERARLLLERLRVRTEANGATAAEAAQAATLAERICRRYGLAWEATPNDKAEAGVRLQQNRFPAWATMLGIAFERRFQCEVVYTLKRGERCTVLFRGPEHVVRVAQWLWLAVMKDMFRACSEAAEKVNDFGAVHLTGPKLVSFRNRFLQEAATQLYLRLSPPPSPEAMAKAKASLAAREERRRKRGIQPKLIPETSWEVAGRILGRKCGLAIELGTDVLPDRREVLCLERSPV